MIKLVESTVSYKEYMNDIKTFVRSHPDVTVYTSPMEDNKYYKTYTSSDGHQLTEVNDIIREYKTIEAHGIPVEVHYDLARTEYYSSDGIKSKYYYAQIDEKGNYFKK